MSAETMPRERIGPATSVTALPRRFDIEERVFPRYEPARHPAWPRRILVGTDGTSSAVPAIAAARAIADRSSASVEMETVYRPRVPLPATRGSRGIDECERNERGLALTLLQRVQRQRRALVQYARAWPLRFEIGDPAAVIADAATERSADLVVTGIGHFDAVGVRCEGRTALRMARQLGVALFAAAPGCESPTGCIIALPDGQVHEPTIRAALRLLPRDAPVWIAMPDRLSSPHPELIAQESPRDILAGAMDGVAPSDEPHGRRLERVDISGDLFAGVLGLVRDSGAQLVAVPNHGTPGQVRVFLPNIAEPLLVAAPCSVLIVPDDISIQ